MRRVPHRRLAVFAAMLGVLIALPGVAAATQPTFDTQVLQRHIEGFDSCGTFDITADFDLTRDITTFYDQNGVAVKRIVHAHGTGTFSTDVSDVTLPVEVNRQFHFDLTDGSSLFTTGFNTKIRLPDGGFALIGAGRMVFDSNGDLVSVTQPEQRLEREHAQVCAAFD
jgi:hypothetical protein